jgi:hypothetical protein
MAKKRRIITDDEFKLVVKNTPVGESPAAFAAKILRFHRTTADKYMLRIFKPEVFFSNNHYVRQKITRKRPVTPSVAQIVLALKMTDGDCCKAAPHHRLLSDAGSQLHHVGTCRRPELRPLPGQGRPDREADPVERQVPPADGRRTCVDGIAD